MPGGAMVNWSGETVWSTMVPRNCLMYPLKRNLNLVSDTAQYRFIVTFRGVDFGRSILVR